MRNDVVETLQDRLTAACCQGDIVARLVGDEFVVFRNNADEEGAVDTLASRIVDLVGRTYVINGHTISIGASVGVAIGTNPIRRVTCFATATLPSTRPRRQVAVVIAYSRAGWMPFFSSAEKWRSICAEHWR